MRRLLEAASAVGVLSLSSLSISLATFISVPVLLRVLGPEVWVTIALAQAFGEIGRVLVVWGWNSIGLAIVAPMSPRERLSYYFRSLPPRLLLLVPTSAVLCTIIWVVAPGDVTVAVLVVLAGALYGLTGGWLFIAAGEPGKMVLLDAVPRAGSILLGTVGVLLIPSGEVFGIACLLGSLVAVLLPFVVARHRTLAMGHTPDWGGVADAFSALRYGLPVVGSVLVMVARFSAVLLSAPVVAPRSLETVALGDKFFRWANTAITPIFQTVIVRVPRLAGSARRRVAAGLLIAWSGGVVLFIGTLPVVIYGSELLSGGQITLTMVHAVPIAVAVMVVFVSAITGNCLLIMMNRRGSLLTSSVLGLLILGLGILTLGPSYGGPGLFWAFAISESSVCLAQHAVLAVSLRQTRSSEIWETKVSG